MKSYKEMRNDAIANYRSEYASRQSTSQSLGNGIFSPMKSVDGVLKFTDTNQYWIGIISQTDDNMTILNNYGQNGTAYRILVKSILNTTIRSGLFTELNKYCDVDNCKVVEMTISDTIYLDSLKELFSSNEGFDKNVENMCYGYVIDENDELKCAWVVCIFAKNEDTNEDGTSTDEAKEDEEIRTIIEKLST